MKRGCNLVPSRIETNIDGVTEGESIEQMLRRMSKNGDPIEATAPMHYFERADGVIPANDIRTDRWEMARQALDKVNASNYAQRMKSDGYMQGEDGNWVKVPETPQGEA